LRVGSREKPKVIDREEVERERFLDSMRFNINKGFKYLVRGENIAHDGCVQIGEKEFHFQGDKLIDPNTKIWRKLKTIAKIDKYLEFDVKQIKTIEEQGVVTYKELKDEKTGQLLPNVPLIAMVVRELIWWKIPHLMKKPQAMIIENNGLISKDKESKSIIIPKEWGFKKFAGFNYVMSEDSTSKIRNIEDARILITDFNIMHSRYFAKAQEECVYSPDVAARLTQLEKQLQIELAKRKGTEEIIS
jgi:hypothetical protein